MSEVKKRRAPRGSPRWGPVAHIVLVLLAVRMTSEHWERLGLPKMPKHMKIRWRRGFLQRGWHLNCVLKDD